MAALLQLLQFAKNKKYTFTSVTPKTHKIHFDLCKQPSYDLSDIFGWNFPFPTGILTSDLLGILLENQLVQTSGNLFRSRVRMSTLGEDIYVHSSFPTEAENSVFFGPDTYRFARLIRDSLRNNLRNKNSAFYENNSAPVRILDIGCGSGAGGIVAAKLVAPSRPFELLLNDINPLALVFAGANAQLADISAELLAGDALTAIGGNFDLIVCNPPYLDDSNERAYRHGGERLGRALGFRFVSEFIRRLNPGGMLVLYTGVAMVNETDPFLEELLPLLDSNFEWCYEEIDPDVFGEELEREVYRDAHRIAAVGLVVTRRLE
jgi:methylase of polypeptide subunit release factors